MARFEFSGLFEGCCMCGIDVLKNTQKPSTQRCTAPRCSHILWSMHNLTNTTAIEMLTPFLQEAVLKPLHVHAKMLCNG